MSDGIKANKVGVEIDKDAEMEMSYKQTIAPPGGVSL